MGPTLYTLVGRAEWTLIGRAEGAGGGTSIEFRLAAIDPRGVIVGLSKLGLVGVTGVELSFFLNNLPKNRFPADSLGTSSGGVETSRSWEGGEGEIRPLR